MRQVLINHARDKAALKRGGPREGMRVTLSDAVLPGGREVDLAAVHEALEHLQRLDDRQAKIAELRFFAGLENKEIAEALGVSLRTVELDWKMAKETLAGKLGG
jgi:RNA polymerase sigma factor (TIGR02999 family)